MFWLDPGILSRYNQPPAKSNHEPDPAAPAILDANEASPQSIGDHPDQGFRKHIIFFLPKITRMGALKFPLSGFSSWTPYIISCLKRVKKKVSIAQFRSAYICAIKVHLVLFWLEKLKGWLAKVLFILKHEQNNAIEI